MAARGSTRTGSAVDGSTMVGRRGEAEDGEVSSSLPWRWLVRHPRPEVVKGLCYGRLDVPAQPEDTERAAQTLARRLPEGLVLRSSPRQRCLALALRLHALRPDLVLQPPEAWLAEMDLGDWEGRLWAELPEAELTAWTEDFGHYQAGGTGESVGAFLARIEAGLRAERTQTDAQVWITHAGVIRGIHWLLEGRLASSGLPGEAEGETRLAGGGVTMASASAPVSTGASGSSSFGPVDGASVQPLPTAREWPRIEVAFGEPWPLMARHRLRISLAGC